MIKSILVATDASATSNRAVDLAADLANKYDASLNILHVIRDMQLPPELRNMAEIEKIEGARSDVLRFVANKILTDAQERAKKQGAKKIHTETGEGDPATAILDHAKQQSADLIVLGTRGLGQVKGMLLGSVSRKVTNLSEISTLVIK